MALIIENIVVQYGRLRILNASTLRVNSPGVTALLGRNGVGKTSIMNAFYGLYKYGDAIVSLDGKVDKKPYLTKGSINYISQKKCHPSRLAVADLITAYGLDRHDFIKKYAIFNDFEFNTLGELSYGMSRLLVVLLAVHARVRYTILDEPFSSVAPVHGDIVLTAIRQASTEKGILISDHQYRRVLSIADRIYLIVNKECRLLQDPQELISYGYLSRGTVL